MSDVSQQQKTLSQAEQPGAGLLGSRIIRIVVGLFALLVVVVVGAGIALMAYRASHNKPLELSIYPGAQKLSERTGGEGMDHRLYVSTDPAEAIEQFYRNQDEDMQCERQYQDRVDEAGNVIEPKAEYIFTRCILDRSTLDVTQYAQITIAPLRENGSLTGEVLIDIERHWGG